MKFSSLLVASALTVSAASAKVKLMFLGDYITEGTCWRSGVWDQLESAGLAGSVDSVGSNRGLNPNCSRSSTFDLDHEAHTRISILYPMSTISLEIGRWVNDTRPDVINIMLGNEDLNHAFPGVSYVLTYYGSIIKSARKANPKIKIVLERIIPNLIGIYTYGNLSEAVPGWVAEQTTTQSPITIADCYNGFTKDMFANYTHPNEKGDEFIAGRVGPKIIQAVKDVLRGA